MDSIYLLHKIAYLIQNKKYFLTKEKISIFTKNENILFPKIVNLQKSRKYINKNPSLTFCKILYSLHC